MVCAINLQFNSTKQSICMLKKDAGGGREGQLQTLRSKDVRHAVYFGGNLLPPVNSGVFTVHHVVVVVVRGDGGLWPFFGDFFDKGRMGADRTGRRLRIWEGYTERSEVRRRHEAR